MTVLATPAQINTFRLMTLRTAIKLEQRGLKRSSRGPSAVSIVKQELGMSRTAATAAVLARLDEVISEAKQALVTAAG